MIKKLLSILLISVLVIGLTGCGNSNSSDDSSKNKSRYCTLTNNMGETEKISSDELGKINKENNAKFEKYYLGAKISFDGTVASVKTSDFNCYGENQFALRENHLTEVVSTSNPYADKRRCVTIIFEEGYGVSVPSDQIDAAEVNEGDKYHVESNIIETRYNNENGFVDCLGVNEDREVDVDLTKIEKK